MTAFVACVAAVAPLPVAFLDMGIGELVVVGVVALLLFGGRLPEVMRTLGASYRKFRRGFEELSRQALDPARDLGRQVYQPTPPAAAQQPSTSTDAPAPAVAPEQAPPVAPGESPKERTAAVAAPASAAGRAPPDDDLPLV